MQKYNKRYSSSELEHRMNVFAKNLQVIADYNTKNQHTIYGPTKFADLTPDEFHSLYLTKRGTPNYDAAPLVELDILGDIPDSWDWRSKGAVTPVYDQGQCGSCWAFSATEAIESQWFLANHSLTELSMQQIVDCDQGRGDEGCNGGDTPTAYEYVIAAGGLDGLNDYPYTGEDDNCAFNANGVKASISSWAYATKTKNETEMMTALVQKGPLSICVDAAPWQFYLGGVVQFFCGEDLDHCVLLTGYEDYTTWFGETVPIWIIRNSWGADWGEDGYIYVERNSDLCGVADEVTVPIV